MPTENQFRKSVLANDMQFFFPKNDINKYLRFSLFLSVFVSPCVLAENTATTVDKSINSNTTQLNPQSAVIQPDSVPEIAVQVPSSTPATTPVPAAPQVANAASGTEQNPESAQLSATANTEFPDSVALLKDQMDPNSSTKFKPIEFEDLESLPITSVDQAMADEIFQAADQAKAQAEQMRQSGHQLDGLEVTESSIPEITEMTRAPLNVDQLMSSIQADSKIVVKANEQGASLVELGLQEKPQDDEKLNFLQRALKKIRPAKENIPAIPKITATIEGAPDELADNIKAKLSSFTVESFSDYNSAVPQMRVLANQAAQAVGYYNTEFRFQKISDNRVKIRVKPGDPVKVTAQNIEYSGAGAKLPQFQVIKVLPELSEGDVFNHGLYEQTKGRIQEAASNNGFFDSHWRLHDVKVAQPENTADINLRYETGERYKIGEVEFRMSDPSKPLPIDLKILKTLAPWKDGADYTAWRVNALANNLTNSRYFNYTLVDAVKPDPVVEPLELAPDLQALVDEQKTTEKALLAAAEPKAKSFSATEVTQSVVDEKQFAGTDAATQTPHAMRMQVQETEKESESDRLKEQAREDKKIPVIVTLNADQLNSLETGLGFGTDTGVRVRGQYRRAIVNHYGHSFDANVELSKIRQSIDGRYNIPYNHPLNDYISLVGGYEREQRDKVGPDLDLVTESAVLGADRIIKGSRKDWQHVFGVRYRLDSVTQKGQGKIPDKDVPKFLIPGAQPEQQALLMGYEISKTNSNQRLNPSRGFKQSYKVELGSDKVISDTSMAIVNANWKLLYSLGENDNHQFVGGANLGYIFADDFNKVPYNLRYFAGGDQSMRGFDYKSLSPMEAGYKVGGQALAVGSIEYNYQFKDGWRAALFSDFGNAYNKDFSNQTEYSVGVGVRWRSPIGPIRIDVASGISDEGNPIRLHFFIGSQL
ncbi:autotransporter secretion outer membrane protein TamA [Acinetobacter calcoaceticus]|uniref:Translocation and assembly module subunit TamA n=1 Tax=Acinetobacter calcoaceticus TaxID=471 RepID=A0A4R1XW39_ACICA|nr:autotransporter secretion outer membrane protein TamA [Acinetobacter calcoaceticus]